MLLTAGREMSVKSYTLTLEVITNVSLLFKVVETSTSEIPASQKLFTLGLVVSGRPSVRLAFF